MKAKRRLLITGIVIGSLLMLSPVIGFLGTVFGMARAFETLAGSGIADPRALSDSISTTLLSTVAGLLLFPLGLIVFTLSLVFLLCLRPSNPQPLPPRSDDIPSDAS